MKQTAHEDCKEISFYKPVLFIAEETGKTCVYSVFRENYSIGGNVR
jgi:hypothetical protein